jgi:AraC-like DNA-binding protein
MANPEQFLPFQPALQNSHQLKNYQQQMQNCRGISHFYSFTTDNNLNNALVIPDNCIDILFDCNTHQPTARVYGTVSRYKPIELISGHRYFGIRFMPGIMPDYIDLIPEDMPDHEYNFLDIIPGATSIIEDIALRESFTQQIKVFNESMANKALRQSSQITQYLITEVMRNNGNIKIGELEKDIGYSSRNIYRIFLNDTGVNLKLFSRFLRMQIAINMIRHPGKPSLTDIATELGFSDQSHFIKDFKTLTGVSPRKMKAQLSQPSGYLTQA